MVPTALLMVELFGGVTCSPLLWRSIKPGSARSDLAVASLG